MDSLAQRPPEPGSIRMGQAGSRAVLTRAETGFRTPGDRHGAALLRRKKAARLVKSRMEGNGRMSRAQYCEQSTFDWRRYSHWKLEVEKARLAAFLLYGGVRTRPMLVKPVLLPRAAGRGRCRAHHRQGGERQVRRPVFHKDTSGSPRTGSRSGAFRPDPRDRSGSGCAQSG